MYKNRSQGFTLIELLVVIAIIGVLSAVVLASLNTARSKGNDAAIQSDMATIQTEAEIYYGGDGLNTYGSEQTFTHGTGAAGSDACVNGMFTDTTIVKALSGADAINGLGEVACYVKSDGTAYLVAAQLTSGGWWCIDQTGAGKAESGAWPTTLPTDGLCP